MSDDVATITDSWEHYKKRYSQAEAMLAEAKGMLIEEGVLPLNDRDERGALSRLVRQTAKVLDALSSVLEVLP